MTYHSSRLNIALAGEGDVVRQILELRRLMRGNPKLDHMIALGYLLKGQYEALYETVERDLLITKVDDNGIVTYTLEVEEKGVVTLVYEAVYNGVRSAFEIRKYTRGKWEPDLDFWYRRERAEASPKLLTAGVA